MVNIYKSSEFEKMIGERHFFLLNEYTILFWNKNEKQHVIAVIDPQKTDYTFEDYLTLPDYAPYELENGKLIFMASPNIKHQETLGNLHVLLHNYNKKNQLGKVLLSPCDVRFDDQNCRQPDLLFVSIERLNIIDEKRVNDAPDLAVELLSGNSATDYGAKMQTYARFGVLEYWVIDLKTPKIEVYKNKNSEMVLSQTAHAGGSIKSEVIKGFVLELNDIF